MKEIEIINLWKSYDQKLAQSLLLNKKNAEELTKLKVKSALSSMKPSKVFTIIAGILWVILIDTLIINVFHVANPFFLVSAGIQVLLTKLAIGVYLYQLVLIHHVDISQAVLKTQEKLARLKSSTIQVARILFLQLPVWTTFHLNESMLQNGNIALYILQIVVTLSFIFISIWLFIHIKFENRDKKWFKWIFNGKEWNPVLKSIALLDEIEAYKNEQID